MGVVYRGRDIRLDRDVALKFLPPDLSADEDANTRFMQEARTASALHHPNVCAIYDIGETDDGALFMVMPLYAGNTIKYRLADGPVGSQRAADIVGQVARGLSAAHGRGVVHRDIKPDNIMLTDDGHAVILDFGVAKLRGELGLTKSGVTVGTAYYMSPEQIRGDEVDGRSDLWSLGVVYYQLLTGRRPFEGDYEQAVSYAILNKEPDWTGLSEAEHSVVSRLLEKESADRFASADELIAALPGGRDESSAELPVAARSSTQHDRPAAPRSETDKLPERSKFLLGKRTVIGIASVLALAVAVAILQPWKSGAPDSASDVAASESASTDSDRRAIAVLPFTNLRDDPETDFLGYATADQVISSLSYVRNLNVRPASSVREYEGRDVNPQEVGAELEVDYVVVGNYLRQADRMRLTVEMVDVHSNEMVWSEPIEVGSGDVFAIQDLVSERVLDRLNIAFSEQERDRMQADVSSDPLAYEYYLRSLPQPRTVEGNRIAMDLLHQSIQLDSTYAPAWSELGFRQRSQAFFGLGGTEMYSAAELSFDRALELNPNLISALADVSTTQTESGQTDEAYELAERAIQLNPNHAVAHFARGYALRYAGMIDESVAEMRRAIELDPNNLRFRSCGLTYMRAGLYDEARRALAIDDESAYPIWAGGVSYILRVLDRIEDFEGDGGLPVAVSRAFRAALNGEHEEGLKEARFIEAAGLIDGENDYITATNYCMNGDAEGCLRNLRAAVENGYFNYPDLKRTPLLDLVRGTPEYAEIMEHARQKHERFKAKYFGGSG
jgi:serine/threonine-protein kinase